MHFELRSCGWFPCSSWTWTWNQTEGSHASWRLHPTKTSLNLRATTARIQNFKHHAGHLKSVNLCAGPVPACSILAAANLKIPTKKSTSMKFLQHYSSQIRKMPGNYFLPLHWDQAANVPKMELLKLQCRAAG